MSLPRFYFASDYAGISSKNIGAYYGYEKTDDEGNWCFEATFAGKTIIIPSVKLGLKDIFDPIEGLLAGITHILGTHDLVQKEPSNG